VVQRDFSFLSEFTEVESGRKSERPELAKALALCKRRKATLVIARLDRLARNVHFISGLGAERGMRYKAEAKARAIELAPILRDLKQQGLSLRGMAAELTKRRVPTPRGGAWHPQLVARVLERLEAT
jgi:DNA invertase Pin-like site-specific DNA recombinase